jgi:hypothetical protein
MSALPPEEYFEDLAHIQRSIQRIAAIVKTCALITIPKPMITD